MQKILLFIQLENGEVNSTSLAALTAANQIKNLNPNTEVIGLLLGSGSKSAAEKISNFGLTKVLFSEDTVFDRYLADIFSQACLQVIKDFNCQSLIASATSTGKDFLPLVAVNLQAGQASDVVGINSDGSYCRPIYAGNILADIKINTDFKIISIRASSFSQPERVDSKSEVVEISLSIPTSTKAKVLEYQIAKMERPELNAAKVIVSGGRGVGTMENFKNTIFPLADALNAAVGASRAVVDAGEVPNDWQVGQTGKIVAPQLYIAVGLSGAIQHLAGMKESKVIVAINKDPEAPIFEVADYGLVGDLFQIVPELTNKLK